MGSEVDERVTAFVEKFGTVRAEGFALLAELMKERDHLTFRLGLANAEVQRIEKNLAELKAKEASREG